MWRTTHMLAGASTDSSATPPACPRLWWKPLARSRRDKIAPAQQFMVGQQHLESLHLLFDPVLNVSFYGYIDEGASVLQIS